jgi:predicted dehydrogenase
MERCISRRNFTRTASTLAASTALSRQRILGANDRIRLGFVGLGNRGDQVLDAFLAHKDQEVTAICDIYQPYMDFASKKIGTSPKQFKDYRKILDLKDVDAVAIETPDHWHALQAIHAMQAGKDVYVEKPLSLCVAEGRRMVQVADETRRITQVGIQRRSSPLVREAVELVRGGAIGKVMAARSFHIQNEWPVGLGNPQDETPPAGLDWEAWLGPAPKRPYNKNRSFYRFRWFFDYSGGQLTNFGVHYMDMIQWALGHNAPTAVTVMGGKLVMEDNREIPDTLEALWMYPGGTMVSFTQINANAAPAGIKDGLVEFRGTKGTLYFSYRGYEIVPDELCVNEFPAKTPVDRAYEASWRKGARPVIEKKVVETPPGTPDETVFHARNFLDCIKSRQPANCSMETGHRSTSGPLIGNIAYKLKAYLEWDGMREKFTNNENANRQLSYRYRAPYQLP